MNINMQLKKKPVVRKILLWIVTVICAIVILACFTVIAARLMNAAKDKMPEGGIHEQLSLSLGGVEQHINIRGHAADHPVII